MDKKIIVRLLGIASVGLAIAALIFIIVSIISDGENVTTTISLVCVVLSNLFSIIRNSIDKKE